MTAMIGSAACASARLAATRAGWHRVAEHILALALYRATGNIGLGSCPGGFRTPSFGTDARFLVVDGTELVVSGAAGTKQTPLTTVRAAAEFAGITPGALAEVYEPATPLDLDAPVMIEPDAARLLAEWYGLGAQALSRLTAEIPGDQPTAPVLWPEHFDVGITAAAINYGAYRAGLMTKDPCCYPSASGQQLMAGPHGRRTGTACARWSTRPRRQRNRLRRRSARATGSSGLRARA